VLDDQLQLPVALALRIRIVENIGRRGVRAARGRERSAGSAAAKPQSGGSHDGDTLQEIRALHRKRFHAPDGLPIIRPFG